MKRIVYVYFCLLLLFTLFSCELVESFLVPTPVEPYKNLTYGIALNKPKGWLTVDLFQNTRFLNQLQSQMENMGGTIICAFANEENPSLPPNISVAVGNQPIDPEKIKEFAKEMDKNIGVNPDVRERPHVVYVGSNKAIKVIVNMYAPAVQATVTTETYVFLRNNGLFIVSAAAPFEKYETLKFLFRKVVSSIKFF
ncbi:MAG TPA: hypothetical protein PL155_09475 [Candidatus Omnitrophota bacterium]|nr:hypothetical protein [Candidatus Omnitrophota bacterium]HPD85670.1 hypothetical protein [Candidatus Omnitrophota bacterium]HRZ04513.1 hypothetical protein [Candidatus Omnitrophota bacterium]